MTERAARSGPAGLATRAGSVLRGAWQRVLHLWRASLGFRVVIVTMLLGILVLTAVGTYLYGSIAQGLVDSRQRIAAEDSLRDATDAQGQFDSTDQTDTQDKLTQFATTLIKSYRRDAGNETRYVVLTRFDDNRSPFIVGPIESGSVGVRFIPDELRQQVAAQPDRQHLQVATIDEGGDTISAVIVGQTVVLPVAGNYGLYFICLPQWTRYAEDDVFLFGGAAMAAVLHYHHHKPTRPLSSPVTSPSRWRGGSRGRPDPAPARALTRAVADPRRARRVAGSRSRSMSGRTSCAPTRQRRRWRCSRAAMLAGLRHRPVVVHTFTAMSCGATSDARARCCSAR